MILSIDAKTSFDKIQHPFLIKALMKLEIEVMYLKTIKFWFHTIWMKNEAIFFKVRKETRRSTLPTLIQYSFGTASQRNKI
jgi:hypothetical protein